MLEPAPKIMNWKILVYGTVILPSLGYFHFRGRVQYGGPVESNMFGSRFDGVKGIFVQAWSTMEEPSLDSPAPLAESKVDAASWLMPLPGKTAAHGGSAGCWCSLGTKSRLSWYASSQLPLVGSMSALSRFPHSGATPLHLMLV